MKKMFRGWREDVPEGEASNSLMAAVILWWRTCDKVSQVRPGLSHDPVVCAQMGVWDPKAGFSPEMFTHCSGINTLCWKKTPHSWL